MRLECRPAVLVCPLRQSYRLFSLGLHARCAASMSRRLALTLSVRSLARADGGFGGGGTHGGDSLRRPGRDLGLGHTWKRRATNLPSCPWLPAAKRPPRPWRPRWIAAASSSALRGLAWYSAALLLGPFLQPPVLVERVLARCSRDRRAPWYHLRRTRRR